MTHSCPRPVGAIDTDLRALRAVRSDAQRELTEVRRRLVELAEIEAELAVTIEVRSRRIDVVLDERLRAATAAGERPGLVGGERCRASAEVALPAGSR